MKKIDYFFLKLLKLNYSFAIFIFSQLKVSSSVEFTTNLNPYFRSRHVSLTLTTVTPAGDILLLFKNKTEF